MSAARVEDQLTIVGADAFAREADPRVNPFTSAIITGSADPTAPLRFTASAWDRGPHGRLLQSLEYLNDLFHRARAAGLIDRIERRFIFQGDDTPIRIPSVSWQAGREWSDISLIPDLYFYRERAYGAFNPPLPRWAERRNALVWRGSSTGILQMSRHELDRLPRYILCRAAQRLGPRADAKLTSVVQCATAADEAAITERLAAENLLGDFKPMTALANYKLLVDVDGNANAWNCMYKLRLGCCMLRVDSPWQQWFSSRFIAWRHYVPVRYDLSDLVEKAVWCLENDVAARQIAEQGRRFALFMNFDEELLAAGHAVFGAGRA